MREDPDKGIILTMMAIGGGAALIGAYMLGGWWAVLLVGGLELFAFALAAGTNIR